MKGENMADLITTFYKRGYGFGNEYGVIQGHMEVTKSLIEGKVRAEIHIVGQINEHDEEKMVEELRQFVKSFYS